MPAIEKAVHLLQPGETAIAVFTDGRFLALEEGGNGTSGYWKLAANAKADKVIVYKRDRQFRSAQSEIYIADFVRLTKAEPADQAGRFVIHMSGVRSAGVTEENWPKFAETGTQCVRYLQG